MGGQMLNRCDREAAIVRSGAGDVKSNSVYAEDYHGCRGIFIGKKPCLSWFPVHELGKEPLLCFLKASCGRYELRRSVIKSDKKKQRY